MNKEQAYKEISSKLDQARKLVKECESLADEYGEGFSWNLAYGMGGYYHPSTRKAKEAALSKLTDKEKELLGLDVELDDEKSGWNSSSNNC